MDLKRHLIVVVHIDQDHFGAQPEVVVSDQFESHTQKPTPDDWCFGLLRARLYDNCVHGGVLMALVFTDGINREG